MMIFKFFRIYSRFMLPTVIYLMCALVLYFGIIPGFNKIMSMWRERQTLVTENAEIQKHIDVLVSLDDLTLRNYVKTLISAVPAEKSYQTEFSTIEAVAGQNGLQIVNLDIANAGIISSQSAESKSSKTLIAGLSTLPVNASLIGTPDQILNFLDTIIQVRRLLQVETFNINFEGVDQAQLNVTLDGYYAPYPETLGKPTDKLDLVTSDEMNFLTKLDAYPLVIPDNGSDIDTQTEPFNVKTNPFAK